MCGIAGVYNFKSGKNVDRNLLKRMCDVIRHRGPDGEGFHINGCIGLGHCRLSIIDLAGGQQPMSNEDGTLWIVFNGEIYNYVELTGELKTKGHQFRSQSDTEAILHLYEEHGPDCLEYLVGMFAFALWDKRKKKLLLAVDRLGIKPLYYAFINGDLYFASEIKSLLKSPAIPKRLSLKALKHYLAYLSVPAPITMFEGINKLEPGNFMVIEGGNIRTKKYWDVPLNIPCLLDKRDYPGLIRKTLEETVKAYMLSDVPLGFLLSGGIDSSSLVAFASRNTAAPLKTFTVAFQDAGRHYNESYFANLVAKHFKTDHQELIVSFEQESLMVDVLWHFDQPYAASTSLPLFLICKVLSQHVKTAMTGIGGDEAFGGYPRYLAAKLLPFLAGNNLVRNIGELLPGRLGNGDPYSLGSRIYKFMHGVKSSPEETYARWMAYIDDTTIENTLTSEVRQKIKGYNPVAEWTNWMREIPTDDLLQKVMYFDHKFYLSDCLLYAADRMSMAHGLELRVPFCDHKLIELAWSIPPRDKLEWLQLKGLLKKSLRGVLPEEILNRPKQGFSSPVCHYLRHDTTNLLQRKLSKGVLYSQGLFEPEYISGMIAKYHSGQGGYAYYLWGLVMFEIWYSLHFENYYDTQDGINLHSLFKEKYNEPVSMV